MGTVSRIQDDEGNENHVSIQVQEDSLKWGSRGWPVLKSRWICIAHS